MRDLSNVSIIVICLFLIFFSRVLCAVTPNSFVTSRLVGFSQPSFLLRPKRFMAVSTGPGINNNNNKKKSCIGREHGGLCFIFVFVVSLSAIGGGHLECDLPHSCLFVCLLIDLGRNIRLILRRHELISS